MKTSARSLRRGTALFAALVCLAVVMALLGSMLVGALRTGRQMRVERDRRQCELLLQAGLDRAVARLSAGEDYRGEVWDLPAAEIIGLGDGQVSIEATESPAAPTRIRVVAEYPTGSELSIRRSRLVQFTSNPPSPQE